MNKSNTSSSYKLQKTIANLISSVISSLCQQVVQYEESIDIFGLLNLTIDNDVEINVKLNEKFIKKKDANTTNHCNGSNMVELSKLITDVQSSQKILSNFELNDKNANDLNGSSKESELLYNDNYKRRPRKPNQTFKHVTLENLGNIACEEDEENKASSASEYEETSLKIDTSSNNGKVINDSNQTDQMDCETSYQNNGNISPVLNVDEVDEKSESKDVNKVSESTINIPNNFKCSVCDRQFKRKFCLTRHKRIHQNYKTHSCNICGLSFDLINQLKRHLRNSHSYSRENLRRSCRVDSKSIDQKDTNNLCCSMDCNWTNNLINTKSTLFPTTNVTSTCMNINESAKSAFHSPSGGLINKRPLCGSLATPTPTNTNFQVRQMLNSIMMAAEASNSIYNPLYFMQPYSTILPTYSQSTPTTSTNSLITPTSTAANMLYRFPSNLFKMPNQIRPVNVNNTFKSTPIVSSITTMNKTNAENISTKTTSTPVSTTVSTTSNVTKPATTTTIQTNQTNITNVTTTTSLPPTTTTNTKFVNKSELL